MGVRVRVAGRPLAGLVVLVALTLEPALSNAAKFKPGQLADVRVIIRGLGEKPPNAGFREARILDPLYNQYLLRTGTRQKARLGFWDGTVLNINQRTDAVLQDPHHLDVRAGEIDQVDAKGSVHRISTNVTAIAGIGTNYDVRVRNGRVVVTVVQGRVSVSNSVGSRVIGINQQTVVIRGRRPSKPRHVNAQAIIAWVRGLNSDGWTPITPLHRTTTRASAIGLTVGGGRLFALGVGQSGKISEFTTSGKTVRVFGLASADSAIAYGHNGRADVVHTVSGGKASIDEYSAAGKRVGSILLPAGQLGVAVYRALAVDSRGNFWLATDDLPTGGGAGLLKLSPSGTVLTTIAGGFAGIALDHKDNLYAAPAISGSGHYSNVIDKFSSSGQSLASWTFTGPHGTYPFFTDLAVSRQGRIFVTSSGLWQGAPSFGIADQGGYVFEVTRKGTLRTIWGKSYSHWPAPGVFEFPGAIAVDTKGNLYVTDGDRIQKLAWFDT